VPRRVMQPSFTGGELAPSLHSRVDLSKYSTGLKTCLNFFVHAHGGVSTRPGFEFINEVKDSSKTVRLIPFQFNTQDTYALEFGDLYMRAYRNGGLVLFPGDAISDISNAATAEVTTTAAHGITNGKHVYLYDVEGMTEINGGPYIAANVTSTTLEQVGPWMRWLRLSPPTPRPSCQT